MDFQCDKNQTKLNLILGERATWTDGARALAPRAVVRRPVVLGELEKLRAVKSRGRATHLPDNAARLLLIRVVDHNYFRLLCCRATATCAWNNKSKRKQPTLVCIANIKNTNKNEKNKEKKSKVISSLINKPLKLSGKVKDKN